MGFKEWIIPQDRVFYDLLERLGHVAEEAAHELQALARGAGVAQARERIQAIEHAGDQVMHETFVRLHRTFITPIDREDIARLAHALDDIVDGIDHAVGRMLVYGIERPPPEAAGFADVLAEQTRELSAGINALRRPSSMARHILPHAAEMHRLEKAGDALLETALARLGTGRDPMRFVKQKEVVESLEAATDWCERAAVVLQDIVRKHA
jgi:hypothetical protein